METVSWEEIDNRSKKYLYKEFNIWGDIPYNNIWMITIIATNELLNGLNDRGFRWKSGNVIFNGDVDFYKSVFNNEKRVIFVFDKFIQWGTVERNFYNKKIYKLENMCQDCNEKLKPIKAIEQIIYYCPKCKK